jgi:hypothetical protein
MIETKRKNVFCDWVESGIASWNLNKVVVSQGTQRNFIEETVKYDYISPSTSHPHFTRETQLYGTIKNKLDFYNHDQNLGLASCFALGIQCYFCLFQQCHTAWFLNDKDRTQSP